MLSVRMRTKILSVFLVFALWVHFTPTSATYSEERYADRDNVARQKRWPDMDGTVIECLGDAYIDSGTGVSVVSPGYPSYFDSRRPCHATVTNTASGGSSLLVIVHQAVLNWGGKVTFDPTGGDTEYGDDADDWMWSGSGSGSGDGDDGSELKTFSEYLLAGFSLVFKTSSLEVDVQSISPGVDAAFNFLVLSVPTIAIGEDYAPILQEGDHILVESPRYPNFYGPLLGLSTFIAAERNLKIRVQFLDFDLECGCCDYLTIEGLGKFDCDNRVSPNVMYLDSNDVTMTFETDGTIERKGFRILVTAGTFPDNIVVKEGTMCGEEYTLDPREEIVIRTPDEGFASCHTSAIPAAGAMLYYEIISSRLVCCCGEVEINGLRLECGDNYIGKSAVTTEAFNVDVYSGGGRGSGVNNIAIRVWAGYSDPRPGPSTCIGDYTIGVGEELTITSPNYPDPYGARENCLITVTAPDDAVIYAQITDYSVECCCDLLTLNGVQQNCEEYYSERTSLSSNLLVASFSSDSSFEYNGFSVTLSAELTQGPTCNRDYTIAAGEEVTITSPNYPGNYGANEDCQITLTAPDGVDIYVQITDYNVECCCDHLTLNDVQQNCDEYPRERTSLSSNQLVLTFSSDSSLQFGGFSMTVSAEYAGPSPAPSTCGGDYTIEVSEALTITSPNYPNEYDSNEYCQTTVTAPGDAVIYVQITDYSVECCCDHLTLNGVQQTCDEYYSERTSLSSNQLVLSFSSDSSVQVSGFSVTISAESAGPTPSQGPSTCGGDYTIGVGEELTITSPNYPYEYGSNENCQTTVTAPDDAVIYVEITKYTVECCCDLLTLNGVQQNCGEYYSERTSLSSNQLVATFSSDSSLQYNGFSVTVSAESIVPSPSPGSSTCGGDYTIGVGEALTITSPNYPYEYDSNENCQTTVTAPDDAVIYVEITDYSVECCCDHLTLNGVQQTCDEYYSERTSLSSNQLVATFSSDSSVQYLGFSVTISAESAGPTPSPGPSTCGGDYTIGVGEKLTITSPNYPYEYGSNENCQTTVTAPYDAVIYTEITDYNVECCCDHLTLNDVQQNCDEYPRERTSLSTNQLVLTFSSDSSVQYYGFSVTISAESRVPTPSPGPSTCGGDYTIGVSEALTITSPNYPDPYGAGENCQITVTAPDDAVIYVQITDYSVECCCDLLTLNGVQQTCVEYYSERTSLSSNQLVATFSSDSSVQYSGFSLTVSAELTQGPTCNRDYYIDDGEEVNITSPNYPDPYGANEDCQITVTAPEGFAIYALITDFNVECCCDFLTINGVQLPCESESTEVTSNELLVVNFTSDSSVQYGGYSLRVWAAPSEITTTAPPVQPVDPELVAALGKYGLTICLGHGTIGIKCTDSPSTCITAENLCDGRRDCSWTHPLYFDDEDDELCEETSNEISFKRSAGASANTDPEEEVIVKVLKYLDEHVNNNEEGP